MLINLTPHNIDIYSKAGVVSIPPFGHPAGPLRGGHRLVDLEGVDGIPCGVKQWKPLEGWIPPEKPGVYYILSYITADHPDLRLRKDIVYPDCSPYNSTREEDGRVTGTSRLLRGGWWTRRGLRK